MTLESDYARSSEARLIAGLRAQVVRLQNAARATPGSDGSMTCPICTHHFKMPKPQEALLWVQALRRGTYPNLDDDGRDISTALVRDVGEVFRIRESQFAASWMIHCTSPDTKAARDRYMTFIRKKIKPKPKKPTKRR